MSLSPRLQISYCIFQTNDFTSHAIQLKITIQERVHLFIYILYYYLYIIHMYTLLVFIYFELCSTRNSANEIVSFLYNFLSIRFKICLLCHYGPSKGSLAEIS